MRLALHTGEADLLAACPQLKILVTSRAVLHLSTEYQVEVPPLVLPDLRDSTPLPEFPELKVVRQSEAVALFEQRAVAVRPDFQLSAANAPAVAAICHRQDGLPLAIELAAARVKLLPPPALLARLDHRLQLLTGGPQDLPARQRTLRRTVEWSHTLLDASEQTLFRRLAVFVGGCTLPAAELIGAVAGDSPVVQAGAGHTPEPAPLDHSEPPGQLDILDGVASLVDKCLLRQVEPSSGEPRLAASRLRRRPCRAGRTSSPSALPPATTRRMAIGSWSRSIPATRRWLDVC